ncbi:signal peptidase II [Staphylococcus simulans]|uniref:signal peptidase II n=1 Tax=Staphylococcus simulans TaxID=1286 RepID=UPI000D1FA0BD|nr:signal peptidase II [Staphylococcus simulans]MDY5059997.1 signal peptidase II [Staphylococcus simulans]PTJ15852.1 signal peptidase II [Staphylococcus simulans]RIN75730.1 lipoprotein signal peptidase [Staphylococcus simulans]
MRKSYFIGATLFVTLAVLILDQFTKAYIVKTMSVGDSYSVIPGFLNITSHRNTGAAWGILSGKMGFFFLVTIIVLGLLTYFYIKEARGHFWMQMAISLLFAGALGNFIDRMKNGEVVDFIDTYIFGYDFPIFNVADSSLTVGVILILILLLFDSKKNKVK